MSEKAFVSSGNVVTLTCPKCSKSKTADVSKYMDHATEVKIRAKCSCGNTLRVTLDRRKFYRKITNLPGIYISEKEGTRGQITVKDLSMGGLKFKVNMKPAFSVNDKLLLEFHLDNKSRSMIREWVIVRNIVDLEIGTKFVSFDPGGSTEQNIQFYLLE
ncbi:MAG TPA: PilZ domain-containing protein [Desulfobacterales bacterium]|nr:PilZ domain-containing protein [Desulfobacterales bacterium]